MSISEFNDFSMSNWSKIQWSFYNFLIFTNFKNFSWNSMIFPWSWKRSKFQWFFKSYMGTLSLPSRASYGVSVVSIFHKNWPCYNGTILQQLLLVVLCPILAWFIMDQFWHHKWSIKWQIRHRPQHFCPAKRLKWPRGKLALVVCNIHYLP